MRRMSNVLAAMTVVTVFAAAGDTQVEAQGRGRFIAQGPFLHLLGPGSTIGASVRDSESGVLVDTVRADSPAARAGLMNGDVVTEFDGERARSAAQFIRLVRETPPGRAVKMTVMRGGSARTLDITPDGADDLAFPNITRDVERGMRAIPRDFAFDFEFTPGMGRFGPPRLGATVIPLSDQLAEHFGVKQGVLVSAVAAGSVAESAGIRAGDVILGIQGRSVVSPEDLAREVRQVEAGSSVEMRVVRERKELTLTAKMPERPDRRRPLVRGVRAV